LDASNLDLDNSDLVLDILLVHLFDHFAELSVLFDSDKESYRKMLLSILVGVDILKSLSKTIDRVNRETGSFWDIQSPQIRNVAYKLLGLSKLAQGNEEYIKKIDLFKSVNLTSENLDFIARTTKTTLNYMILEFSGDQNQQSSYII
jgi:hypothetical protein